MADADDYTPAILQNDGVPIPLRDGSVKFIKFRNRDVAALETMFDGLRAIADVREVSTVTGPDGATLVGPDGPVTITKVVGQEERTFYGLEAFQKAMEMHPADVTLKILAQVWGASVDDLDEMLDPTGLTKAQQRVAIAWSIAQGVDPTLAARQLAQVDAAVAKQREALESQLIETTDQASGEITDSLGSTGSPPGSTSDETSAPSGS